VSGVSPAAGGEAASLIEKRNFGNLVSYEVSGFSKTTSTHFVGIAMKLYFSAGLAYNCSQTSVQGSMFDICSYEKSFLMILL